MLLMVLHIIMHVQFREEDFQMRSPETYDRNCTRLEEGLFPDQDSVTYGLNYRSTLNKIENFHVAKSQLPQDIMHILFEGVIPLETKLMLYVFIYEKKYFTLDQLNDRIKNFCYGRSEARNKMPKPIESAHLLPDGKLRLSGVYSRTSDKGPS